MCDGVVVRWHRNGDFGGDVGGGGGVASSLVTLLAATNGHRNDMMAANDALRRAFHTNHNL